MSTTNGPQQANARWDIFALVSAAPLGPFVRAHLAPRIPPELLNAALVSYLPLKDDEILLAIIDPGGPKPTRACALTTRRVYWTESADQSHSEERADMRSRLQSHKPELAARYAAYGDLPESMGVIETSDGTSGIALDQKTMIETGKGESGLASAMLRFLKTMRAAERDGNVPQSALDADLVSRAAQALPRVVKVTAEARAYGHDLAEFSSLLHSTPQSEFVTPILIGACILAYIALVGTGVDFLWPSAEELLRRGASRGINVTLGREYWRLFAMIFLHGGLIHLCVNMWSLFAIGPLVEKLYGNLAFTVIYLASGVGGAIASLAADPLRIGVGASGALCGILGAFIAFLIIHRRAIPRSILRSFRTSLVCVAVLMAILGYFVPNIDHQAHLGGLVTGFLSGFLLTRPWPFHRNRWISLRRASAAILIVVGVVGAALLVTATPGAQRSAFELVIIPIERQFDAIAAATPSTLVMRRDIRDPAANSVHRREVKALISRAVASEQALRRLIISVPRFRKVVRLLGDAQTNQLGILRAALRFLETGDREHLSGAGGMLDWMTETRSVLRSIQQEQANALGESNPIRVDSRS